MISYGSPIEANDESRTGHGLAAPARDRIAGSAGKRHVGAGPDGGGLVPDRRCGWLRDLSHQCGSVNLIARGRPGRIAAAAADRSKGCTQAACVEYLVEDRVVEDHAAGKRRPLKISGGRRPSFYPWPG